jgi:hypothetical protein
MNDREAIKVLRALPGVLKAFAKVFKGTTDPRVKQACDIAIKAIKLTNEGK